LLLSIKELYFSRESKLIIFTQILVKQKQAAHFNCNRITYKICTVNFKTKRPMLELKQF